MSAPDILFSTTLLVECLNAAGWSSTTDNGWRKLAAVREKLLAEFDAALARAESAAPSKFDFAAHDAAFVEWWSREGSGFHPAAIEDREEFTRRIANLAWIISANVARNQGGES